MFLEIPGIGNEKTNDVLLAKRNRKAVEMQRRNTGKGPRKKEWGGQEAGGKPGEETPSQSERGHLDSYVHWSLGLLMRSCR